MGFTLLTVMETKLKHVAKIFFDEVDWVNLSILYKKRFDCFLITIENISIPLRFGYTKLTDSQLLSISTTTKDRIEILKDLKKLV